MTKPVLDIRGRLLGPEHPCFIIGEVAQAHEGSLGMAHAFIDAIAATGADAVKFQTHIAVAESSALEPWRVRFSFQDATRYDYWKRMEFTAEQWGGLKQHAEEKGMIFLSSPFSVEAVEMLERIGISAWKIASGEVSNPLLLSALQKTGLPMLFSSGMSSWNELDKAMAESRKAGCQVAVMQCSTRYPCPPEKIGLNLLPLLRERYQCPVGLSDHSGVVFTGLAAVAQGCDLYETHVALSRDMFGPDVVASLVPAELKQLVEGIRYIEAMKANPVDKDTVAAEMEPLRKIFGKSLVVLQDLPAGTLLTTDMFTARKPGHGIAASEIDRVVGRKLSCPKRVGEFLTWQDLGDL